jgi:hypothetical protein
MPLLDRQLYDYLNIFGFGYSRYARRTVGEGDGKQDRGSPGETEPE